MQSLRMIWKHAARRFRGIAAIFLCAAMMAGTVSAAYAEPQLGASAPLTGKTAAEITAMMGIGWNIGNTFDATGGIGASHETSWGNPKVTKELIHAVKEAGFNVIRIPITWEKEIKASDNYKISDTFMNRIQEVVDWCYEEDLFVIINVHHESWLNKKSLDKDYRAIGKELAAVWAQIADRFADYDQHLIFEGMNEPRMAGSTVEWTGNRDGYAAVNYLLQVFVDAVRSSGKGHNDERCLMIPGYAASSSTNVMSAVSIPNYNGKSAGNLIASVHCYSPYNFCLQDKQMTFSSADESEVKAIFEAIRSVYLDNGIPVVLGETSATAKDNTEEREKWAFCMGKMSSGYGIPIVIWDNGSDTKSGGESHAYINRKTCEWNYPTVVKQLFEGAKSVERGSALASGGEGGAAKLPGSDIWTSAAGWKATKEWDSSYIKMGATSSWFAEGRSFGILYKSEDEGEPKMILDSETRQAWWIPVEPTRRETTDDGYKVIWYDYETILAAMKENGVTEAEDLRNLMFVATTTGVTTYEVTVTGSAKVTYYVNGQRYALKSEMPEDPVLADWVFLGWYLSKTYDQQFTKDTVLPGDAVVYAMLRLKTDEEIAAELSPTPEPTKPVEATPTPEGGDVIPTAAPEEQPQHEGPSPEGWTFIVLVGVGVLVVVCAAVYFLTRKKKEK